MKLLKLIKFMFAKSIYQRDDIVIFPWKNRDLWQVINIKRDWQNLSFVYILHGIEKPIHEYMLVFYNQILDSHFFSEQEHYPDV